MEFWQVNVQTLTWELDKFILYSHLVLPYTEEYQGNLANVNKYMYTL